MNTLANNEEDMVSYREKKNRSGRRRNWKAQERRRESALIRQEESDGRSFAQRIFKLDKGGFAATKERIKLSKEG